MSSKLTAEQVGLLRLANDYGDGFDLTGPRIPAKVKDVAKTLIASGHLVNTRPRPLLKGLSVTDKGRSALSTREG